MAPGVLKVAWALAAMLALGTGQSASAQPKPDTPANKGDPADPPADGDGDGDGDGVAPAPGDRATPTGPGPGDDDDGPSIDELRAQYLQLRDKLFQSRARAATVGDALYSTRMTIYLSFGAGRFYAVTRATVRLDGANVYDDIQGTIAEDNAPRFDGFVAPGRHRVSVRLETTGKDDDAFGSIVDNTFVIQAPAGKDVTVAIKATDNGDIASAWQKKAKGSYELRMDVKVTTADRAAATTSAVPRDASGARTAAVIAPVINRAMARRYAPGGHTQRAAR